MLYVGIVDILVAIDHSFHKAADPLTCERRYPVVHVLYNQTTGAGVLHCFPFSCLTSHCIG